MDGHHSFSEVVLERVAVAWPFYSERNLGASPEKYVPEESQQPVINASEKAGHPFTRNLGADNGGLLSFTDGQSLAFGAETLVNLGSSQAAAGTFPVR